MIYLWLKSFKQPDYRKNFSQRLGLAGPVATRPVIWVHGASVGEITAATPLIRRLLHSYPNKALLVTTVTPTGAAWARETFGDDVLHCYLPLDAGFAVRAFIKRFRPEFAVIMETEIWPTLYGELNQQSIPIIIASARLSQRSVDGYARFLPLIKTALSGNVSIAAQTPVDRERFLAVGASPEKVLVTGNIKFDFDPPKGIDIIGREFRNKHGCAERPVWVAASTHEGEEEQVLAAHAALRLTYPDALLLLVPRHPERFDDVAKLLQQSGVRTVRRSSNKLCEVDTQVLLCDSMGEMMMFYAASDLAFLGGSLVDIGGHNLLEPASLGKAIICGPSISNAKDVAEMLVAAVALQLVENSDQLSHRLDELFAKPISREELGKNALKAIENNRGSLERLMAFIKQATSKI